jgi:hypothetical protein
MTFVQTYQSFLELLTQLSFPVFMSLQFVTCVPEHVHQGQDGVTNVFIPSL